MDIYEVITAQKMKRIGQELSANSNLREGLIRKLHDVVYRRGEEEGEFSSSGDIKIYNMGILDNSYTRLLVPSGRYATLEGVNSRYEVEMRCRGGAKHFEANPRGPSFSLPISFLASSNFTEGSELDEMFFALLVEDLTIGGEYELAVNGSGDFVRTQIGLHTRIPKGNVVVKTWQRDFSDIAQMIQSNSFTYTRESLCLDLSQYQ